MSKPSWFLDFETQLANSTREQFSNFVVPQHYERSAAVLILFGPHQDDADILIIERAAHLVDHPGQPAFPGGHVEEHDKDLFATALREAQEEIGLDPTSVRIVAALPQLWLPPSQVAVTPIVAWWEQPHELTAVDTNEVANVHRIPIRHLIDPQNRISVKARSGYIGPAFKVNEMVVWGFTGGLVSALIDIAGLTQEWDKSIQHEINLEI